MSKYVSKDGIVKINGTTYVMTEYSGSQKDFEDIEKAYTIFGQDVAKVVDPKLKEFMNSTDNSDGSRSAMQKALKEDDVFLLRYDEELVAFIRIHKHNSNESVRHCTGLWSSPKYRGRGLGAYLLKFVDSIVRVDRQKIFSLSVLEGNPAIHLYQRHGFKKVNTTYVKKVK